MKNHFQYRDPLTYHLRRATLYDAQTGSLKAESTN